MADPISSFSGLASGIQWRDLIDQIMSVDSQRQLDPVNNRITSQKSQISAWTTYQGLVAKLSDAASSLKSGTGFGVFQAAASNSDTSGRALVGVTASSAATPGNYKVEVVDLARAAKLSGTVVADTSLALGASGDFLINGKTVTVSATDSINSIRDKINAVNSGSAASKVSATILSTGGTAGRLILTSDVAGAAGIALVDGSAGVLQSLGVLDGTTSLNGTGTGAVQTNRFSSTTASIASALGIPVPAPSSITVNGRTIAVDLSTDSLASIVARINAAGGSASTVAETANGATVYRMVVSGTVGAATADGQRALEVLGLTQRGRGQVAQVVSTGNALTNALGATATTGTLLTDLGNGAAAGVQAGDTITIGGKRGDGTAVNISYTVTGSDTVQDLLGAINNAVTGFGAGTRPATASLSNGRIVVTDGTGGDSQLALSIVANNEGGATLDFGSTSATTVGRLREVVAGSDAQIRVDGVLLKRNSNSISDAIGGVTLNLLQAEAGTTVTVGISRDFDGATAAVQKFASAYNDIVAYVKTQGAKGAALQTNSTLRTTLHSITSVFFQQVNGLGATNAYQNAALTGVALTKTGTLDVDPAAFTAALASNFDDVSSLFSTHGTVTDGETQFVGSGTASVAGSYDVAITAAATRATLTGSGFSGTYADDATSDTMSITDGYSGRSGSIALNNGDTIDVIVTRLNAMFDSQKLSLAASKSGTNLVITGNNYGSGASFTVGYTAGGTDGSAQLGFAAGTYAGTNVAGTIGGLAATGSGQVLTGVAGGVTDGLAVRYIGATARAAGSLSYVEGLAGLMTRTVNSISDPGLGVVANQITSLNTTMTTLTQRADDVQRRLDLRRAQLTRQFTNMETALSKLQAQQSRLTAQINALSGASGK